jgi:phage/plasmid-like protein (TIGR03299 family)
MMYVGEKPWHGLGTYVGDERITSEEAIVKAGLDWDIELTPLSTEFEGHRIVVPDQYSVTRMKDGKPYRSIGTVGSRYEIVANEDAFEFFDNVVGDKLAIYETAGALRDGTRIFILAKLPNDIIVKVGKNKDKIEEYLLLTTAHDGSLAIRMLFTPVRVVCMNTLNFALSKGRNEGFSIKHTKNVKDQIRKAQEAIGLALEFYEEFGEYSEHLARSPFGTKQIDLAVDHLFPLNPERRQTKTLRIRDEIARLSEEGIGIKPWKGTAYGFVNAVAEYADHHKTIRSENQDPSRRQDSIWFGTSRSLKQNCTRVVNGILDGTITKPLSVQV